MPLHAVTAMYGEQGLRARFAAEMERFPDRACRQQVWLWLLSDSIQILILVWMRARIFPS